jgi:hypothetical protein
MTRTGQEFFPVKDKSITFPQRAISNASFIFNPRHYMGWVITATYAQIYPRESAPVSIVGEAQWKPGPICTGEEKISCLHLISNHEPSSPVSSRCTASVIPVLRLFLTLRSADLPHLT